VTGPSAVRIAVLFPEMLGTYGDGGNALALAFRLQLRGLRSEVIQVGADQRVPVACDLYLLGGSEDGPQEFVADVLAEGHLATAVSGGAGVLAVCSGMQLLGREFVGRDDRPRAGLGLLPCRTFAPTDGTPRTVGEVVVRSTAFGAIGDIVGFENHRGQTVLEPGATPLGTCLRGFGNTRAAEPSHRVDGVLQGKVLGTYLHGPVLALNPQLADAVLAWATGPLAPVDEPEYDLHVAQARRRRLPWGSPRRARRSRPA
jgi:CobQ-like glutamine amidotransferase family enzyme